MEDIKEKTADELFKKLGYDKINEYLYDMNGDYYIKFDQDWREIKSTTAISMQELQAINKKCKEMNWI